MTPVSPVGGEVDVEALAVEICNHSGRHTAGDGDHDADKWGPCSQCTHYARVVEPIIAARLEAAESARDEALAVVERARARAESLDTWPDYLATEYDRGRVDQRHADALDLLAALTPSAPTEEGDQ